MSDCGSRTTHTAIHDHLLPGGTWPPNHLAVLAAEARQVEKKETGKVVCGCGEFQHLRSLKRVRFVGEFCFRGLAAGGNIGKNDQVLFFVSSTSKQGIYLHEACRQWCHSFKTREAFSPCLVN